MGKSSSDNTQHKNCSLCSTLADKETATAAKNSLPAASDKLNIVVDLKPFDANKVQLRQCPQCRTYYIHRHLQETGQELTRLTETEIAGFLNQMAEHSKVW